MTPNGSSISVKYIILAAALLGTIQAVTWLSLSIVSILFYNSVIEIGDIPEESYGSYLYKLYLNGNNDSEYFIIRPKTFNYFMFIYLVLSFVWLLVSCFTLWAVLRGKWNFMTILMIFWSSITIAIAVTDIILMSLIAADLQKAHDLFNPTTTNTPSTITATTPTTTFAPSIITTTTPTTTFAPSIITATTPTTTVATSIITATTPAITVTSIVFVAATSVTQNSEGRSLGLSANYPDTTITQPLYTAIGIAMSIAARGYVLWVVNVTFAIMLLVLAQRIRKTSRPSMLPAIDAYATGPRPFNLYEQTDIGNGHKNSAFTLEESTVFSPRQTFDPRIADNLPKNPLSNSNRSSINNSQPQMFLGNRSFEVARPLKSAPSPVTKLAKIGRSGGGRRTPPTNVSSPVLPGNAPYIPDPDYTPPGSPHSQPKSVLRPRSKYVL